MAERSWKSVCIVALTTVLTLAAFGWAGAQAPSGTGAAAETAAETAAVADSRTRGKKVLTALFVVAPKVYNSELMAPYDVLQHTIFRDDEHYVETAVVSADGKPLETFEGITVVPHYSFENAPEADILVIPSTEGSMDRDLEDAVYMSWIEKAVDRADWVITVCDGAFPLAATGALDGRVATTFPGDRERFQEMFPEIDVRFDVRLVVDGKFITSVGGGMSYEPAFYLVEKLFGKEHADKSAGGLVWPWDLATLPHVVVDSEARAGQSRK